MKHSLILAAVLLASSVGYAKTICNVNAGNPKKDMEFDRILYSQEITQPKYLLVANGKVTEIEPFKFKNYEQWKAINGSTLVTVSPQENGAFAISVGDVDLSKTNNALPLRSMAIGAVTEKNFLNLISPKDNLSILCFEMN